MPTSADALYPRKTNNFQIGICSDLNLARIYLSYFSLAFISLSEEYSYKPAILQLLYSLTLNHYTLQLNLLRDKQISKIRFYSSFNAYSL
jgi:hypothetical protein